MNDTQKKRVETVNRVVWFVAQNQEALKTAYESAAFTELQSLANDVQELATAQVSTGTERRSRTEQLSDLRESLRSDYMMPIAAIAKVSLADSPLIVKMVMPRVNVDEASLITFAHAMADAADQNRGVFLAQKLPGDFVERLREATERLHSALKEREGSRVRLRQATRALQSRISRAADAIKVVGSLLAGAIRTNAELREGWLAASTHRNRPSGPGRLAVAVRAAVPVTPTLQLAP